MNSTLTPDRTDSTASAGAAASAAPAAGPDPAPAAGAERRRVLIVDDEPDFTYMMGLALEQTGRYEVREENQATGASRAARDFKPDVILLDVMMPDLDGGDVLNRLREEEATRDIPVIFLTALVEGEEASAGLPSGGHCFLPKPVNLPKLLHRLEQLLDPPAGEGAPART